MYQVDQNAYWQAQVTYWAPKVLIAILILIATWIVVISSAATLGLAPTKLRLSVFALVVPPKLPTGTFDRVLVASTPPDPTSDTL